MTIIDRGRSSIQSSLDIRQNAPKKSLNSILHWLE